MSRVAGIVCAVSLALYGASCFIVPTTLPKGAPQTESGAVVGQPSAINGTPESASWSPLAVGAALGLLIAVATGRPALAADLENGEAIFNGNCTACHEALVQYGKYDVQAIITQVTNGNGAMPAFGEKLGPDDIEDVANYVYNKADKWLPEVASEARISHCVWLLLGTICSLNLSTKTMSRVAGIVCAVSLALYGASCFIVPTTLPKGAPQTESGAVVGQPSAINGTPESASWSPLAVGAALGLLIAVATGRPALAADLENGEAIFNGNCTACHAGGNNSIVAEKKLKKEALVQYGKYDVQAIITQVTNGNGAMPAFGEKLGPDDIEDVANYVYNKADKWPQLAAYVALGKVASEAPGSHSPEFHAVMGVWLLLGTICSLNLSTKTMSRVAGIVCTVSLALYGASCFIVPTTLPKGAPQTESGAVVGQPSAINGTPESASWSPLAVGAALGLLIAVATGRPALAADLENGEAIFNGNCTACHAGGNNSIVAEKKLKKEALVQYGKYDVQAIITQVTNGNGAMPAFGEKLGPDDIEDVANYVYNKVASEAPGSHSPEFHAVMGVWLLQGTVCSLNLSTKTMSRVAGIVCAVSLALYGASCFIVPTTLPKGPPQTESGAVVGQPSAINGTPESASWSPLAVGAALGLLMAVATGRPALAADLENGEAIFNGNCTACHAGGNNSIVAEKKLKKEALVQYGKYDVQAIITQVTNGNGAMPAFGEKLGPDDIEDVANYVYNKADKW
ncbi:petJ [Symbiodinium sp. CCMP2592]|nr:petJ [Symbiodinium sp. CCMP2592]